MFAHVCAVCRHRGTLILEERQKVRELEQKVTLLERLLAAQEEVIAAQRGHIETLQRIQAPQRQLIELLQGRLVEAEDCLRQWKRHCRGLERVLGRWGGPVVRKSRRERMLVQ